MTSEAAMRPLTRSRPGAPSEMIARSPDVPRPRAVARSGRRPRPASGSRPLTEVHVTRTALTCAVGLQVARQGARFTAVDVSWRAVATARLNALRQELPLSVAWRLASTVTGIQFDLIVSNPPYPGPGNRASRCHPIRGSPRAGPGRPCRERLVRSRTCTVSPRQGEPECAGSVPGRGSS
ncbi:methyltransferase [Streptomyces sp. NPDC059979]|uniref:methyltransferase n=1 Tax=Streptomyces sp. NPDC059979 TaxID=3347021 RepID=UPI003677D74F